MTVSVSKGCTKISRPENYSVLLLVIKAERFKLIMLFLFFNYEFVAKNSVTVHLKFVTTNTRLLASQLRISQTLWPEITTSSNATGFPFVISHFQFSSFSKLIDFLFREKINEKKLVANPFCQISF